MKKKLLALFLCCVMVFSLAPAALTTAFAAGSGLQIYGSDGALAETVQLEKTDKTELTAVAETGSGNYQWQIHVSDDVWANIVGTNGNTLELSYGLVANALDNDAAEIRCKLTNDVDNVFYSNIVTVQIQPDSVRSAAAAPSAAGTVISEAQPVGEPVIVPADTPAGFSAPAAASDPASADDPAPVSDPASADDPAPVSDPASADDPATASDPVSADDPAPVSDPASADDPAPVSDPASADDPAPVSDPASADDPAPVSDPPAEDTSATYNVVINYSFENGTPAADSYTANLAAGSSFSATVTFPTVQGYLPYLREEQQDSIYLNYSAINQDYTYDVVYKPTNVDYTVIHYQQNLNDDNYTEAKRETKQGLTNSTVPEVAKTYEGFYALLYEKPSIAADGSTVVEVYYDRYYYLMNFDLDGGYGVEPIYARYGTPISDVGTPTKAGYSFSGWSLDGATVGNLPETMPAENCTYKAVWEADNTAKVTVVFWGENADDEEYSYIRSMQVDATPGASYSYDGSMLVCPLAEHSHDTSKCTLNCTHVHTLDCYSTRYSFVRTTRPSANLTDTGNGIYTYTTGGWIKTTHYYLNIGDEWYCGTNWRGKEDNEQSISYSCKHTHTDACYSCGLTEHTHSSACSGLWKFVNSDTVTVAADGSSVVNVYYDRTEFTLTFKDGRSTVYTIKEKWGADISEHWPIKGTNGTTYDHGERWKPSDSETYTEVLVYLSIMPAESFTLTTNRKDYDTFVMHYMVEVLPGESGTNYNGKTFKESFKVTANYNYVTKDEDFFDLDGFTQWESNPSFRNGQIDIDGGGNVYFYYTRNSYNLTFNDGYNNVKSESVKYEAPLSTYSDYVPDVPSAYGAGSVTFGGWYLNPECTGAEYKLNEHTMPADNVLLYAKWVPVTHTVEFYLDKAALDTGTKLEDHDDITVPHGSKADPTPADPTNGSYTFIGWFYMENGVEKAFDFANMPVTKDMKVYGKWSSNVLKQYTIYYKIQDTDTEIAAPTTGSGLAGITKTFDAKGGTDLYTGYQEGYFPVAKSHSLTIDIENEANNSYTFWYVQKDAVPYTVKYLNKETGEPVATEKTVSDNRKAVVTETFVPVSSMMPDAYQKRLVVSVDKDGNPDTEHNVIIFYYTEDTTHAYYKITHYTENLGTDTQGNRTWTEYASSQAVGDIGSTYKADPMTIPGFTYDSTVPDTVTSGELTANGLELKLYYTRNSYPYQVRYLEQGTGKQLADPKDGTGKYGQVISESAIDITNYAAVDPTSQTLNIRIEESQTEAKLNIITFYYKEKEVTINYKVIGPDGCGTVTPTSEILKVLTGTAQGSTATANENFRFVGWYTDANCTQLVEADWVNDNNKLTPVKEAGAVWTAATYYAKFEDDVADLTITKHGWEEIDENQRFLFDVTGPDGHIQRVVVKGNGSVTIKGLKIGEYTVKEVTSWSWRYTTSNNPRTITLQPAGPNEVTFENTRIKDKWLGGDAYNQNTFDN